MSRCVIIFFAVFSLTTTVAGDEMEKAITAERANLQGKWKLVGIKLFGKQVPRKATIFLTIDGDKWTYENPNGSVEWTSLIDPAPSPKAIDLTPLAKGQKWKELAVYGIYKLEEGTLTICTPDSRKTGDPMERPKAFKTANGEMIRTWKQE